MQVKKRHGSGQSIAKVLGHDGGWFVVKTGDVVANGMRVVFPVVAFSIDVLIGALMLSGK
jgi:hypothetical protein